GKVRLSSRRLLGRLGRAQAIQQQPHTQPTQSCPAKYGAPPLHTWSSPFAVHGHVSSRAEELTCILEGWDERRERRYQTFRTNAKARSLRGDAWSSEETGLPGARRIIGHPFSVPGRSSPRSGLPGPGGRGARAARPEDPSASRRVGGNQVAEVQPAVSGQRPFQHAAVHRPEGGQGACG